MKRSVLLLSVMMIAAMAFGQTVLARAVQAAGLGWDTKEAHSAIYDAEKTADLFCHVINRWSFLENSFDGMSLGFSES